MSHYIIPAFLTILLQQKQRRKKKRKGRRNGKDGRRREDDVTRNCLLYLYLKIVLSLSIANLKSCILHCVTTGKKWSTVFKLYAKTCLYFFLFFFSDGRNIIGLHITVASACSVGVFWAVKAYSSLYFCSYHLWFYDKGRLGDASFLPLFWSFNMALSRAKTFACPKKTLALQASLHSVYMKLWTAFFSKKSRGQWVPLSFSRLPIHHCDEINQFEIPKLETPHTLKLRSKPTQNSGDRSSFFPYVF